MTTKAAIFKYQYLFITSFLLILILPLVMLNFDFNNKDYIIKVENRMPNPAPNMFKDNKINTSFGLELEKWLQDKAPYRAKLIKFYNKNFVQHTTRVLYGQNGYLFYTKDDSVNMYKRNIILSDEEIKQHITPIIEIANKLKEKNIKFYWMIPPNKHTVYPEFFPKNIKRLDNPSRLDQIIAYINKNKLDKLLNIVDVRQDLESNKTKFPFLYYETDTHWNTIGAFLGHQVLINAIKKDFSSLPVTLQLEQFDLNETRFIGDLARSAARNLKSTHYEFTPKFKDQSIKDKNIIVYRDSFFENMMPFIDYYFNNAQYYTKQIKLEDIDTIISQQPDMVVYESVERLA